MFSSIHLNARKKQSTERRESDPTEAEIAACCEAIQETWSEQEKISRQHFTVRANAFGGAEGLATTIARPNFADLVRDGLVSIP